MQYMRVIVKSITLFYSLFDKVDFLVYSFFINFVEVCVLYS